MAKPGGRSLLEDDPHFFRVENSARPFLCRSPGCGASFGTLGAAVRHLKSVHTGVLPLFTSTETDAHLRVVWDAAGLDARGFVPSTEDAAATRRAAEAVKAARDARTGKARWESDPLAQAKRPAATSVRIL
jgi:hypothetical protein